MSIANVLDVAIRTSLGDDGEFQAPPVGSEKDTYGASLGVCLPFMRVAIAWICTHANMLVASHKTFEPHITYMYQAMTRCITRFFAVLSTVDVTGIPYLLPEDADIVGLKGLEEWGALYVDGSGPVKPRFDDQGIKRHSEGLERLARIFDIAKSSVDLLTNRRFPWHHDILTRNGYEYARVYFEFNEWNVVEVDAQSAAKAVAEAEEMIAALDDPEGPGLLGHGENLSDPAARQVTQPSRQSQSVEAKQPAVSGPAATTADLSSYSDMDDEVFNRVQTFLNPPEVPSRGPTDGGDDTSYGMHSSTAEEIFGQLQPTSPSRSANKPIPSLPWNNVWAASPKEPTHYSSLQSPSWEAFEPHSSHLPSPQLATAAAIGSQHTPADTFAASPYLQHLAHTNWGSDVLNPRSPPQSTSSRSGDGLASQMRSSSGGPRTAMASNAAAALGGFGNAAGTTTSAAGLSQPSLAQLKAAGVQTFSPALLQGLLGNQLSQLQAGRQAVGVPGTTAGSLASLTGMNGPGGLPNPAALVTAGNLGGAFPSTNFTQTSSLPSVQSPRGLAPQAMAAAAPALTLPVRQSPKSKARQNGGPSQQQPATAGRANASADWRAAASNWAAAGSATTKQSTGQDVSLPNTDFMSWAKAVEQKPASGASKAGAKSKNNKP